MASFIVKQMVGDKVKGLTGGGDEAEPAAAPAPEDPEVIEAKMKAEEERKMKYMRLEQEREKMRQGIRDKYKMEKKPGDDFTFNFDEPTEAPKGPQLPQDDSLAGKAAGMLEKAKDVGGMFKGMFGGGESK